MRHLCLLIWLCGCGEVQPLASDATVDPCTGTCQCRVDADCTVAHSVCDDRITDRSCECAAGYTEAVAGTCAWSGVIADPGFQSMTRWTLGAAIVVDTNLNVAGMIDPGAAVFTNVPLCALERVSQGAEMPRLSRAEPLVIVTTYRYVAEGMLSDVVAPAVGVGSVWHDEMPFSFGDFTTSRFCLGASQYAPESSTGKGAPTQVELMPAKRSFDCPSPTSGFNLEIDHVEIKPADPGECPAPGTASNGDAEADGGWAFNVLFSNGVDNSTAKIESGFGEAGSRAARLFMHHRCDGVSLLNKISISNSPMLASPAISIFNRTSSSATTLWNIGGVPLPAISGSGQPTTIRMCAPAFMRGGAFTLTANIDSQGLCSDAPNFESAFDNFKVINDPSCGTDANLTDPGFESPLTLIGAQATQGRSLARTLNDPANAHTANGVLQLSVDHPCEGPTWQANIVTPASAGASGPALTFFYKATPKSTYAFSASNAVASLVPVLDNQYHQGTLCLDPKLVGRNQAVRFAMSGGAGTCANVLPAETAFVDDLALTTDPSCPAQ
ncbi:MAG: hypothetical protein H6Q90_2203 [Deltaproteobacteria bacterium]|nr:hypothetical protein [Deltaproteobacteria bacterium]